jgi:hypothetical protein
VLNEVPGGGGSASSTFLVRAEWPIAGLDTGLPAGTNATVGALRRLIEPLRDKVNKGFRDKVNKGFRLRLDRRAG